MTTTFPGPNAQPDVPPTVNLAGVKASLARGPRPGNQDGPIPDTQPRTYPDRGSPLPSVPGYEILGELGRGGMGVVYKARDTRLRRLVALKMILAGAHAGSDDLRHFRAEAEAVAALQHPNVVQIHEVGEHQGLPYFTMEFVDGGSLDQRLAGQPQPPRDAAALVGTVARAIHFAHSRGIVHRDLKPANVLIVEENVSRKDAKEERKERQEENTQWENKGSPLRSLRSSLASLRETLLTPKVTDFGLAKRLDSAERLTRPGVVVGTPSYMAPEQVQDRAGDVGPATDTYALGVLLYEMLTGRVPFLGLSAMDTATLVVREEPLGPRQLNPTVPRDLETICLMCLQKEPRRRYATALELSEDLARYLAGEPIAARPVGVAERSWKWARRHPAVVALSAAVVLVTVLGFGLVSGQWWRAESERGRVEQIALAESQARAATAKALELAEQRQHQAEEEKRKAERLSAAAVLDIGTGLCEKGNGDHGLHWLARGLDLAVRSGDPDLERVARVALAQGDHNLLHLRGCLKHGDWAWAVAFSPDGKTAATGGKDRTACLWDTTTGQRLGEPLPHDGAVWAIAFSPDGKTLLTGSGDADGRKGEARLWDVATRKPLGPPLALPILAHTVAFSPDGYTLLTAGLDAARLWPAARGLGEEGPGPTVISHEGVLRTAAFSPDGRTVLTGADLMTLDPKTGQWAVSGGEARLWDATTGRQVGDTMTHRQQVEAVAFSPDARRVLTGSWDHTARLWDAATGRPLGEPLQHPGPVKAVAFGPDGRLAATGCLVFGADPRTQERKVECGEARVWDLATGQPLGGPLPHSHAVWSLAFHPAGRLLLTGCEDRSARFWLVGTGTLLWAQQGHEGTVRAVAFSPDGRQALTACAGPEGNARLWDVPQGLTFPFPMTHVGPVAALAFSPDGRSVAAGCVPEVTGRDPGGLRVWEAATGRLRYEVPVREGVGVLAYSPDGLTVATASHGLDVCLRNAEDGRPHDLLPYWGGDLAHLGYAADGKSLLAAGGRLATLWDPDTCLGRTVPNARDEYSSAFALSPDGKSVLLGKVHGEALLVDAVTGATRFSWRHKYQVRTAALSPDGRTALTGSWDNTARLWDTVSGKELTTPLLHPGHVDAVAFSPDGHTVATASDNSVRLWDTPTGRLLGPPLPHPTLVSKIAFSPDGRRLATGDAAGAVRLWDMPGPMPGSVEQVREWARTVTGLEMDEERTIRALDPAALEEARQRLRELGGTPAREEFAAPRRDDKEPPPRPRADAPPAVPTLPGEALVLPAVGAFGRNPIPRDSLEVLQAAGKWAAPKAGDEIKLPDGSSKKWEAVKPDKDGVIQHGSLNGGYAYFAVPSDRDRVLVLEAAGSVSTYVNGEPRAGDLYSLGFVRLPVLLKKGTNDLLFHVGRGQLQAKLVEPKADAGFNTDDLTLPDLVAGDKAQTWGGVVVLNVTNDTADGLEVEATVTGGEAVVTPIPSLVPQGVRKAPFRIECPKALEGDKVGLQLRLVRKKGGQVEVLDTASLDLGVRKPADTRKVTFRSDIDGSVQYYSLVPALPTDDKAKPGLVLTLHGAVVEAAGQAACYAPKPGLHVVAATNRRPYGFDWEDWGRLDALEVLNLAEKDLGTDPRRTYLTGHSMGGHGTWHVGVTYPDKFAAIGPSAGWISMWSYAGAKRPESPDGIQELFLRASSPSDTLALSRNTLAEGVYILHGDKDDNVPVDQARTMKKHLEAFHKDLAYHEQPGAGHWWGNDCVDWAPMFEFLTKHTIPERKDVKEVEFVTASPGVSADCHWLTIEAQEHEMKFSSAKIAWDAEKRRFTGTTENVSRLSLDLGHVKPGDGVTVDLDGQSVEAAWPKQGARVWLIQEKDKWSASAAPGAGLKGPSRYGPFREAFRNRMVFVYGTKGTAEENAWALAKARYDAETFWYRGNGSVDVVPDTASDATAERDRNVVLYGNADDNGAWKGLLGDSPVQVHGGVLKVGDREEKGDDLACLFVRPRPGSDRALVAAVSGTGVAGMRLTNRLPYFVSGVGYPDCVVFGPDALEKGTAGVRGAGFFGVDWGMGTSEFVWRK